MHWNANFWQQFQRATCYPDHCNCEAFSSAFIMQPFATITSLPIIILGFYFLISDIRAGRGWVYGALTVFIGISSTYLHMGFTKFGIIMDFGGINLIFLWFFFKSKKTQMPNYPFYYGLSIIAFLLILYFLEPVRHFLTLACGILGIHALVRTLKFNPGCQGTRDFKISFGIFIPSFILMQLDLHRVWCTPDALIHGHSIWHLGVALSLFFTHRALRELNTDLL